MCWLIVCKCMCERGFRAHRKTSWIVLSQGPESSLNPPNQSLGAISAVTSAGFPPANTANCVWSDTRCRRLNPQPLRRKASAFSPAKEDFWTHVLQPFHCGVSLYALMLFFFFLNGGPPWLKVMWLQTVPKRLNLTKGSSKISRFSSAFPVCWYCITSHKLFSYSWKRSEGHPPYSVQSSGRVLSAPPL